MINILTMPNNEPAANILFLYQTQKLMEMLLLWHLPSIATSCYPSRPVFMFLNFHSMKRLFFFCISINTFHDFFYGIVTHTSVV